MTFWKCCAIRPFSHTQSLLYNLSLLYCAAHILLWKPSFTVSLLSSFGCHLAFCPLEFWFKNVFYSSFEVFTMVTVSMLVLSPEDGGSMFLWNVCIYIQVYTTSQPTRPTLASVSVIFFHRPFTIIKGYKRYGSQQHLCAYLI
jgi:hypothetical protein